MLRHARVSSCKLLRSYNKPAYHLWLNSALRQKRTEPRDNKSIHRKLSVQICQQNCDSSLHLQA